MTLKIAPFLCVCMIVFSGCTNVVTQTSTTAQNSNTASNQASSTTNNTSLSPTQTLCSLAPTPTRLPAGDVLALSQEKDPQSYAFAESHSAELIPVDDNKSYVVWWAPTDFNVAQDTVIVSLHGHGEWATKDFEVWYPEATSHHYAYLGVQWWFGRSLESIGYYDDIAIAKIIETELAAQGVPPGHVIFQGFSMGGTRTYGVTMYDALCGQHYFGVTISNAGSWKNDYPLHTRMLEGDFGTQPLKDTHWIWFCAAQDADQTHSCDEYTAALPLFEQMGAHIDLFFNDPQGEHGSFMRNANNVERALTQAEEILND